MGNPRTQPKKDTHVFPIHGGFSWLDRVVFSMGIHWASEWRGFSRLRTRQRFMGIGVLFGCFGRKMDGDSWFTWCFFFLIYQGSP